MKYTCVDVVFWIGVFIVFYTYVGYGVLLYVLVKIKELFIKRQKPELPEELPTITMLIAAYNEELVVKDKMVNCMSLAYPKDKLNIIWVTDGSTDRTNILLGEYSNVTVVFDPKRGGKAAALNHGMKFVDTSLVVYTDANTMICENALIEIVKAFSNPKVGCVAGEKRVLQHEMQDATAGEGIYWRYESALKDLDYRLYSVVGAAGELFAIRTNLYIELPNDTLLDDFVLSLKIAQKGYKIAYCKDAYAMERASADINEESKRKVRIAAGGLQSIWRLRSLLNIFRYPVLGFQYISHRVLRWSITPRVLLFLLPINIYLVMSSQYIGIYDFMLVVQLLFYALGICGYILSSTVLKYKFIFIPFYFLFMNINVLRGSFYLRANRGRGVWDKAKRG